MYTILTLSLIMTGLPGNLSTQLATYLTYLPSLRLGTASTRCMLPRWKPPVIRLPITLSARSLASVLTKSQPINWYWVVYLKYDQLFTAVVNHETHPNQPIPAHHD
ncbi:hypothetical protein [Vulcanisaeta sp. JCM 14467]